MTVRQAIIPAAGLGTRFLPVTKIVPKELLPLLDKPSLQHVIDEAVASGVEEFIIVISKEKKIIEEYYRENKHLNQWLLKRGQGDVHALLKQIETKASFHFAYQDEPLGLGHAVACARSFITDDYFFVLLPDDIIDSEETVCQQLIKAYAFCKKPIVSVLEVPWEEVHRYGIVEATPHTGSLGNIKSIVEKPSREKSPSNLAVIGRYLLPKDIFRFIEKTKPGAEGEIQLTDALRNLITETGLMSYAFAGERFDTGTPVGLLKASISLSLKHALYQEQIKALIKMLAVSI